MNRQQYRFVGVMVALMMLVGGCGTTGEVPDPPASQTPPAPSASPTYQGAELLARPMGLPELAAGQPCPVTTDRQTHEGVDDGLGTAPMFPVAYYFHEGTVMRLREMDRVTEGYVVKVRWQAFDYEGPVLIRMGRLDGEGQGEAKVGERVDGGRLVQLTSVQREDFPAVTLVSGPGCWAYQVDGDSFSEVIVFEAREVTGE